MEHLQNPIAEIKNLKNYLTKKGMFLITIPNADRLRIGTFLKNKHKFQPVNDILYSFSELSFILKLCGLRMIYWKGIGPILIKRKTDNFLKKIIYRFIYPIFEFIFRIFNLFYLRNKQLLIVAKLDKNIKINLI